MADVIRVLHVDDDSEFTDLAAHFLERQDDRISVETASSASEALERLSDTTVDCLVSDYQMPEMDGIAFLKAVREEYPDLPFILYTGKGSEEIASEAISAGVTDYLQKGGGTGQYELLANRITNVADAYQSSQKLQERTRRLETLISNLPGMVYRCKNAPGWPMVTVEGEVEELTGYPAEALEADEVVWGEDILHPEDREPMWEAVQDAVSEHGTFEVTYRIRTRDDTLRWMWERGRGVYEDGDLVALEGFITDMTERQEREQRLERLSARLNALFEQSPDMVTVYDTEGNLVDPNPSLCDRTGWDEAALTEMKVWDLDVDLDPEDARAFWAAMDTGDRHRWEGTFRCKDGSTFPVEVHIRRLDLEGKDRFLATSRDITDRRERERDLERVRDFFTEAERLGDLGAWEFDASGSVVWTEGTRRIHEVDEEYEPTLETALDFFHPEDRERLERVIDEALEAEEPYDIQARLTTAAGRERWVRTRGEPVADEPDTVRGYIQDITQQKERERRLEQFETIVEAIDDATFVVDADWTVDYANRASLDNVRAAPEEVEGRPVMPLLEEYTAADEDPGKFERALERAFEATDRSHFSDRVELTLDVDGWQPTFEYRFAPVVEDGRTESVVVTSRDVTERAERERELERQNEQLEEFASIVSHDLQNPLNVASGRLELAGDECESEHLDRAAAGIERSQELVEDLLTLAREGEELNDVDAVDLAGVVEDTWTTVDTAAATVVTETDRTLRANRSQLQQLVENLVRNAIDHGGEDVTVTVGALPDGFYVADDGPGIPPEDRDRVFDAGYSTGTEGTGFGLRIVRQVADAHGWEISVTDSESGGARFEITGVEFADCPGG